MTATPLAAQLPVLDMHLHAEPIGTYGPPPGGDLRAVRLITAGFGKRPLKQLSALGSQLSGPPQRGFPES